MPETDLAAPPALDAATSATVLVDPDAQPPVDPESLVVRTRTFVSFRLTAAARLKYEFSVDPPPIVIAAGDNFPDGPVRRSDSWVTLFDAHASSGVFEYTINVVHRPTGQRRHIDPQIRNET